jgi:phage I-like protein
LRKDDVADRRIEKLLGLPDGQFSAAFSRGRAPALSDTEREICRMTNCDPREFARMRAIFFGRTCLMSVSKSLPADGHAPEWIEILPLGEFNTRGEDGRGPFHADGRRVIAATKANGLDRGLPIDYDHRTFNDADSRAAGWIRELKIAGNTLLARVEWTPAGAAAVAKKEYRFISPVFKCQPDDPKAPADEISGEVLYLRGAALTNDPALSMKSLKELGRLAA